MVGEHTEATVRRDLLVAVGAVPPTDEERARIAYPVLAAMLAGRGATMPASFDDNAPDVRARLVTLMRVAMGEVDVPAGRAKEGE